MNNILQYVLCYGILPLIIIVIACAGYAHHIDAQRADNDPQKRHYPLLALIFTPVGLIILPIFYILGFLLKVLLYGAILILFPIALIVVRQTFLFRWLHKIATYIGNKLLDANTFLIELFFRFIPTQPEMPKSPYKPDSLARRLI